VCSYYTEIWWYHEREPGGRGDGEKRKGCMYIKNLQGWPPPVCGVVSMRQLALLLYARAYYTSTYPCTHILHMRARASAREFACICTWRIRARKHRNVCTLARVGRPRTHTRIRAWTRLHACAHTRATHARRHMYARTRTMHMHVSVYLESYVSLSNVTVYVYVSPGRYSLISATSTKTSNTDTTISLISRVYRQLCVLSAYCHNTSISHMPRVHIPVCLTINVKVVSQQSLVSRVCRKLCVL